ncbi:MAG: triose-phosphate isomerase [Acidobacteriia bacterium]|nr:triose-phosphate isomerase [Methyloceanibacter sp.]MBX5473220.1 triose-phosphate isomerase [Acetobacteraceae bacterium]MCL6490930.1 triose-phosphate isomerase [Terriglobia bacterium]
MLPLIAGNWKMHLLREDAIRLVSALRAQATSLACELLVCPPATVLADVAAHLAGSPIMVGGQDCHQAPFGPHTGDISAPMLRDAGASWVILGHSERRSDHHESDALVCAKAKAALAAGLKPVVCVGETQAEREAGQAERIVSIQLAHSLPDGFSGAVAYEPVWAIGSGRTPTETEIAGMHSLIREALQARFGAAGATIRILYGGSVKPENAESLLAIPEVSGALVGGASLKAESFLAIARAVPSNH